MSARNKKGLYRKKWKCERPALLWNKHKASGDDYVTFDEAMDMLDNSNDENAPTPDIDVSAGMISVSRSMGKLSFTQIDSNWLVKVFSLATWKLCLKEGVWWSFSCSEFIQGWWKKGVRVTSKASIISSICSYFEKEIKWVSVYVICIFLIICILNVVISDKPVFLYWTVEYVTFFNLEHNYGFFSVKIQWQIQDLEEAGARKRSMSPKARMCAGP